MGIQDSRLLRWAANQFYANTGTGALWRDGVHPTKVEPSAGDYIEGFANDIDTRAEVMNWLQNQADAMRNGIVMDRMTLVERQVNISGPPVSNTATNAQEETWDGVAPNAEYMSGVWSTRFQRFTNMCLNAGTIVNYRSADARLLASVTLGSAHAQAWSRGIYLYNATAALSYSCMIAPGLSGVAGCIAISDTLTFVQPLAPGLSYAVLDVNPIPNAAGDRMFFLGSAASVIYLCSFNPSSGATPGYTSTGLATTADGFYNLIRLSTGRIWVITSRRAAYSDNDGATWTFDGAASGTDQGGSVVYDEANARWIRFNRGTGGAIGEVRVAANPNIPTAATVLKTVTTGIVMTEVVRFGRFTYAIGGYGSPARFGPMVSPDFGLTWIPCTKYFTNIKSNEGPVAQPMASPWNLRISTTPFGIVARVNNTTTGFERAIVSVPMWDLDNPASLLT